MPCRHVRAFVAAEKAVEHFRAGRRHAQACFVHRGNRVGVAGRRWRDQRQAGHAGLHGGDHRDQPAQAVADYRRRYCECPRGQHRVFGIGFDGRIHAKTFGGKRAVAAIVERRAGDAGVAAAPQPAGMAPGAVESAWDEQERGSRRGTLFGQADAQFGGADAAARQRIDKREVETGVGFQGHRYGYCGGIFATRTHSAQRFWSAAMKALSSREPEHQLKMVAADRAAMLTRRMVRACIAAETGAGTSV